MDQQHNKINKLKYITSKIDAGCSDLERIIYLDAINLLNNDVNPDKVMNWVNNCFFYYFDKPKTLSIKEKELIEKKKREKQEKIQKKDNIFNQLNVGLQSIVDTYGLICLSFFEYKSFSEGHYSLIETIVKNNGLFIEDFGDGAIELVISKTKINRDVFNQLQKIKYELYDIYPNKKTAITDLYVDEITQINDKIKNFI